MYELTPLKITHGIHASSYRTPHKVAIRYGDRSVTFSELVSAMGKVSFAAFTDIRFQGNAAIIANNSIEYIEILLGLADVGVPVITVNPKSTSREVIAALVDSKTRVLFIDEKLYKEEYKQYAELIITIGDEYRSWISKQQQLKKFPLFNESTLFNIVYSSGTTGAPKGICISHRTRVMSSYTMAIDYRCMSIDDTMLCLASLSNGGGSGTLLATLTNGGTVIIATQVHPDYIMRTIERYKVTCMFIVPVLLHMLLDTPSCFKYDRRSLKGVFSSAAPFNAELKTKALEFFGDIVWDVFASTECGPTTVQSPIMMRTNTPCVGYAVSGSIVRVLNAQGDITSPFEVGEIYAKTLTMFSGYLNKDKPEEFVSAGDLGYVDPNGLLYVVGRKNDMIITGGNNVYPEEVESIINNCPGVIESAVVGTPDDKWGEIVTAYIVGQPTVDIDQHCRDNLASYKIPRDIRYVDSIPKSEVGKILRKNLRNSYK